MMIILAIFFIVFLAGAVYFLINMSRPASERFKFSKGDAGTGDEENPAKTAKQAFDILKTNFNQSNPETAQEFLPFEEIQDSMIYVGNGLYRMLIEVSSLNYYLRTEEEQETVEQQFRRALQHLSAAQENANRIKSPSDFGMVCGVKAVLRRWMDADARMRKSFSRQLRDDAETYRAQALKNLNAFVDTCEIAQLEKILK